MMGKLFDPTTCLPHHHGGILLRFPENMTSKVVSFFHTISYAKHQAGSCENHFSKCSGEAELGN